MGKKVTLITTVRNEAESITIFLNSITAQTRMPDEVIIVDAYSKDKTVELITHHMPKIKNLKVVKKRGNRSTGRNEAIRVASYETIAVTDAGCILDKHWLERLTKPFEKDTADVVAGFYKPKTNGPFEESLAAYTCTMQDKLDVETFLPSSRSVAFKKSAWEKVGGYPENLDTCEDLVFDKKLKSEGLVFVTVSNAIVYWPQRKNILQAAKQFFIYAKGDGKARYFRRTTPILFLRYLLGMVALVYIFSTKSYYILPFLIILFVLYLFWAVWKNNKYVRNIKAYVYLPLLQLVSDVTVIVGTTIGFITA